MKRTRKEAMQAIERFYNTGQPCKNGHHSDRYTVSGGCVTCVLTVFRHNDLDARREFARLLREKEANA